MNKLQTNILLAIICVNILTIEPVLGYTGAGVAPLAEKLFKFVAFCAHHSPKESERYGNTESFRKMVRCPYLYDNLVLTNYYT